MPETFQTSFIPKTPFAPLPDRVVVDDVHQGPGILGIVAYFILFVSIVLSGGVLWYRASISQGIDRDLLLLEKAEATLDQSLLQDVRDLDNRIAISQRILDRHYSVAAVIEELGKETTPSIQFEAFMFGQEQGEYLIQLDGFARSYTAIAEQSRSFSESTLFNDHLFSGIALDDTKALVRFKLEIVVPMNEMAFSKIIEESPMVEAMMPVVIDEPPVVQEPVVAEDNMASETAITSEETEPVAQPAEGDSFDDIRQLFEEDQGESTPPAGPVQQTN